MQRTHSSAGCFTTWEPFLGPKVQPIINKRGSFNLLNKTYRNSQLSTNLLLVTGSGSGRFLDFWRLRATDMEGAMLRRQR